MRLPTPLRQSFSPYRDPEPWADFYDDTAQRGAVAAGFAIIVHILLFLVLQPSFRMPDIPEDPEAIPVQIIAYEPAPAEETPPPVAIRTAPQTPAPAIAPLVKPRPKPKPKPKSKPTPAPPPPQPKPVPLPEPEPQPEPDIIPPEPLPVQPEILASETQTPDETVIPDIAPAAPVPEPLPDPVIEPEPLPEVPLTEPPVDAPLQPEPLPLPEPVPDPVLEPVPEPVPEPIIEPDPVIEPVVEPDPKPLPEPVIEPEPFPEIELEAEPLLETPLPDIVEIQPEALPEPVISEAIDQPVPDPGPAAQEADPELPLAETLPLPDELPSAEVAPEATLAPEPELETPPEPDAPAIITTAPTILASTDAPTTIEEVENAVPQSQADPMIDFRPGSGRPPGGGAPITGGPAGGLPGTSGPSGTQPSSPGGTRRANPGAGGWTLAPRGGEDLGVGFGGLVQDVRCREDSRTHEDCPEYAPKYQGRNIAGFESFGAHSPGSVQTSTPRAGTQSNQSVGGGTNPWARGIGNNSVNAGGPSESVLDDADFGRTFLGTPLGDGSGGSGRVRDVFAPPVQPWDGGIKPLPVPVEPLAGRDPPKEDEKKED